jgi:hypothetical protein
MAEPAGAAQGVNGRRASTRAEQGIATIEMADDQTVSHLLGPSTQNVRRRPAVGAILVVWKKPLAKPP